MLIITGKMIHLSPPKGINKLTLHYDADNGWLVEIWKGENGLGPNRYTKCKNITINGIFTTLSIIDKLPVTEYYQGTEEEIITMVSTWQVKDYKQFIEESIQPQNEIDILLHNQGVSQKEIESLYKIYK